MKLASYKIREHGDFSACRDDHKLGACNEISGVVMKSQ